RHAPDRPMPRMIRLLSACFAMVCGVAHAAAAPGESFDLRVADPPQTVRTDAGDQVFEELHLASFAATPLRLERLQVVDADGGRVLATFDRAALERRFVLVGAPAGPAPVVVPPGRHGVVFIEWKARGRPPHRIGHVVTYAAGPDAPLRTVRGGVATVADRQGAPLGPPLRGG